MRAGMYCSQSSVELSTNEAKYFATVLLKTSTWALHWGCAGVVVVCLIPNNLNNSLESLLTNSLPLSE